MTDIETRLREAFRAEGARVQPHLLRELRLPAPRRRLRFRPRRPRASRRPDWSSVLPWLAPVAAALAVVAVISAVRLAADDRGGPPPRVTPDSSLAVPATAVPPFYVSFGTQGAAKAWVHDSATGQVISKVGVPGQLPIAISGAADDRTFAIIFQDLYRGQFMTFTRLVLGADGHPASFEDLPLKLPANTQIVTTGGTALSPDGQTLALALYIERSRSALIKNPKGNLALTQEIELISLRTGVSRAWPAAPGYFISSLSWARGNQTLAFLAGPQGGPANDTANQLRVLDVSRPPGGLLSSSTVVRLRTAGGRVQSMQVTDHGSMVIALTRMPSRSKYKGNGDLVLGEFATRTGRQLLAFSRLRASGGVDGFGEIYSADPSGQHIILSLETRTTTLDGRLDIGPRLRLSHPPQDTGGAGSW